MAGAAAPAAQAITIGNSGGGALATPFVSVDFGGGPTGWIATAVSGTEAPFTLTVTPSSAVAAGAHTATIQVASAGASNTPASVTVQFTVDANAEPVIAVTDSALQFTAQIGAADPASQTLIVSNGGGGVLADPTVTVDYGAGTAGWLTAVAAGMDVTVTASLGALPRGRYEATLSIASAGAYNAPLLVPVVFEVTEPALAVAPASLAFVRVGDVNPLPKTITVSNSADGTLAIPAALSNRTWLAASVSGTSAPFTVTVSITAPDGYPVGTYTGSVTIDASNASNGPVTVPVTLTVSEGPPVKVSCYSAASSMCVEFTSTSASERASFQSTCTGDGDATVPCPSANKIGPCAVLGSYDYWFYAPYTVDTAIYICSQVSGTWEGPPAGGGTPRQVSLACNFPLDKTCTDVSGMMTQGQEDGLKGLCTTAGGTVITTCATFNRIGTCTSTQGGITYRDRYYTGSGLTAADCAGVWTAN
jgi:hypothetical protein